ncbi:DUF4350 domain-containing protein [Neobacillus cucumis]|uniref:DUF4350 domain-containing protein n=1 Tax=Neobacillus cucumis TaxID=1740721 RepID=A0A2N5HVI5_9BACI|nr:DUF4350 domain-containing protein [Neobacillus cucumis]PLS09535.1 DUF4350 domain-containing protein [Neobacillus cucumis]
MKTHSKKQGLLWFIALLLLFIAVSYFAYQPKPEIYPSYVTVSPSPTGVKALYTYLKKEKEVKSWIHSPDLLPKEKHNQLLVMVGPAFTPEKKWMQQYINFMEAGNTILLMQTNPKGMFNIETDYIQRGSSQSDKWTKVKDENGKTYRAEVDSDIRIRTVKNDDILLSDQSGAIAAKRAYGKGQLIMAITPQWMTNEKLLKKDHLPLSFLLLKQGKADSILFDEYIHGGENESSILTVYPKWFLVLILQGILLVVLWLWYKGKRFGPLLSPREEWVRYSDEKIQAIAAWYLRGRRYQDSLRVQADYVKLLLQEQWQIPYSKDWQDLSPYFERKWLKMPANEIQTFLGGIAAILNQDKINQQEYLLWSRKLEELRNEVES